MKRSARIEDPGQGLRLAAGELGRLELFPDRPRTGDLVLKHEGSTLLLIDEDISSILSGAIIDSRPTADGPQLVVDRSPGGNGRELG